MSTESPLHGHWQTPAKFIALLSDATQRSGSTLDPILERSQEFEHELRALYASDRTNPRLTSNANLIDVFDPKLPDAIRRAYPRTTPGDDKYVFPLQQEARLQMGDPTMVTQLPDFEKQFGLFTERVLDTLDWSNVAAAGGSVLASLRPIGGSVSEPNLPSRAARDYYHQQYPTSDIDLFLYDLMPAAAEAKIRSICEAVKDSNPLEVAFVRTKHTISIHSQFPFRTIQVVLRLYSSPAEILAGFDVDAPCVLYTGTTVLANPRAIVALMRQCNTVDMTRRSPSYEARLAKYARHGFEVYIPQLQREKVKEEIYQKALKETRGLARLLVLEDLQNTHRRIPGITIRQEEMENETELLMSDYDIKHLHLPYDRNTNSRKIAQLVIRVDTQRNGTVGLQFSVTIKRSNYQDPYLLGVILGGRRLHRHLAFTGTVQECIEGTCEDCPVPEARHEKEQANREWYHIRGHLCFIEENPGRQFMSGSFHPLDTAGWAEEAYE